jgi:hypothetical protein
MISATCHEGTNIFNVWDLGGPQVSVRTGISAVFVFGDNEDVGRSKDKQVE